MENKSCYEAENYPAIGGGISEQLRSAVFGGEYCYQGAPGGKGKKNVNYMFKDQVNGYGDTTLTTTHDAPHATDLVKGDGAGAISGNYVHDVAYVTVKSAYSHLSRSPRHCRGLCSLTADWGANQQLLHYLTEIRFVASEVLVHSHFITDLPTVVMTCVARKRRLSAGSASPRTTIAKIPRVLMRGLC